MALICTNCNADNPRGNRFCDTCGAKLPKEESAPAPAAKSSASSASAKPPKAKASGTASASRDSESVELLPSLTEPTPLGVDKNFLWLLLIVGLGAFYRLWELGFKPLHHDESIHAWYAYKLFKGEAYSYDPAYHGPFRYHMNALMFFIFGASDFTTRILPAALGIFGMAFMWQWRSLLGTRGSLIAAAIMAISPTWVYNARFIRDDITMTVGSMAMVWGLFKWFESRQDKYLYWGVAGWAAAFTSHEGTWIFMGIFGTFLFFRWLWERFANPVEEENHVRAFLDAYRLPLKAPRADFAAGILALFLLLSSPAVGFSGLKSSPLIWLITLLFFFTALAVIIRIFFYTQGEVRRRWLITLAVFFIPFTLLYSTFFTYMDGWFKGAFDSIAYWLGEQKTGRADQPWQFYIYMLALYELAVVAFAFLGGFRIFFGTGKPQYFWMKLVAFLPIVVAIEILVHFPKNPKAVLPMAALASLGSGLAAFSCFAPERGNLFKVFLIYWSILGYAMFTIAGERMPWLTLHPLTPMTLLAGLYLGEFFDREKPLLAEHWVAWAFLWIPGAYFLAFLPRQLFQVLRHAPIEFWSWIQAYSHGNRHGSFQSSGWPNNIWTDKLWKDGPPWSMVPVVLFAVLIMLTPFILDRWPKLKEWTRGIFIGLFILGLTSLSHGTHNLIFRGDGADPREQHVYVQSSVELVELSAKLERMSRAVTGGPYLKVAVEDLCSWPLSWYLRDLKNAQIGFGPPLTLDKVKDFPVVITGYENINQANHDQLVADSFKADYVAYPIRFRRWWAPDKNAFFSGKFSDQVDKAWNLFMYREPWLPNPPVQNPQFKDYVYPKGDTINSPFGSFDACVWVRKDVDRYYQ